MKCCVAFSIVISPKIRYNRLKIFGFEPLVSSEVYGIVWEKEMDTMSKLYFKYGTMGSSKTAQALMTRFNYLERGRTVWLIKPQIDNRDGETCLRSRIGLEADAQVIAPSDNVYTLFQSIETDVIIVDECQFLTSAQIDQLRNIVDDFDVPVLCFGLRTDFLTHVFPGSLRLLEVADSLTEIKTICSCGAKAIVNARLNEQGDVVTEGEQVLLGGNDRYVALCHRCWKRRAKR